MSKKIDSDKELSNALVSGIGKLANVVGMTLGPRGRNVIISSGSSKPYVTKDGVTVAKEVALKDDVENVGAQLVKEASSKTNDSAGDGTTTSTVLAYELVKSGMDAIENGASPISIKRGMDKAVSYVVDNIKSVAKPITSNEEIVSIATISANNDVDTGALIADAINKVGRDGIITTGESRSGNTEVEVVHGYQFDHGFISPYLAYNTEKMLTEFKNPLILLMNQELTSLRQISPLLEKVVNAGRPLVIIANDIQGDVIPLLVMNKMQGAINACAVKSPEFGDKRTEALEDIAVLTGAHVISPTTGKTLDKIDITDLGSCEVIRIDQDKTTIIGGKCNKDELDSRITSIRTMIDETDSEYTKKDLESRLGKLVGGVAVINVGALTEVEMKEKMHRIEDALASTRAAIDEGIVAGGGTTLASIKLKWDGQYPENVTEQEKIGYKLLIDALSSPINRIASNAGIENIYEEYKSKYEPGKSIGYDAYAFEWKDMIDAGIIDPAKVTRCAIENATSAAGMILTTGASIITVLDPVQPAAASTSLI